MSIELDVRSAVERLREGHTSYPWFVLELERAVDAAEAADDPRAQEFRRHWGELEIINALSEGVSPSASDLADVNEIIEIITSIFGGQAT